MAAARQAAGLYVHVPFCRHRCGYCDFNVLTGHDASLRETYVAALRQRLGQVAADGWPAMASVFIGGGTPTQLTAGQLGTVLGAAREQLWLREDAEVTVEANPEDLDAAFAEGLAAAGVNRVSLGAQSFDAGVLSFLDRLHDPATVPAAVRALRAAGIAELGLDLIYGTPGETAGSWAETLRAALALEPTHVSCYALTLSPGTPYWRQVTLGQRSAPDDDLAGDRMQAADEALTAAGYERYETSNWALPGSRCRHNLATWAGGDYLGVGAGAHSHRQGRRWWERRATHAWLRGVDAGDPVGGGEQVSPEQQRTERALTGLRTVEGVARSDLAPVDERACRDLVRAGLVIDDGEVLRPTRAGLAQADALVRALLA